ncbi:MAG TPA: AAA family ATPase [Thermoleophilia bacterium]|nr:AAA family ATPase [Thermoleophilia bacterium]
MSQHFHFANSVPDRSIAERFITAITGSVDTRLAWLFHDTKELVEKHGLPPMPERTSPPVFPGAVNGTLAEVWDRIVMTQAAGGAVSLRVNVRAPDPNQAQHGLDVYHFRALYLDFDCSEAEMKAKLDAMQDCPQTVLVKSRRSGHAYWALANNLDYNAIPEAEWRSAQAALTEHFGGDQNLKSPGSQLRLPGTWNFKDPTKPHLLTAVIVPERRYTPGEVLDRFGLKPVTPPPRPEPRPLEGAIGAAVANWLADHGEEYLDVRKHTRCPVCEGDGGCKPYDEEETKLICFSTHHEATGTGTRVGTGFVFSALDIARGETPLPVFLRQQRDDDGQPYLTGDREVEPQESAASSPPGGAPKNTQEEKTVNDQPQDERKEKTADDKKAKVHAAFACRASEVKEEPLEWVTPGLVVRGKLHIIEGDKGCAKSTVGIDALANWSRGRGWLGGRDRAPANGLILAPEDGVADTIVPKLRAAGADMSRVFIQDLNIDTPTFPDIVNFLEEYVVANHIEYMVIDSLMSCMGTLNSHKDQDVRVALMPLRAMLERTGCTAFAIRHLNKNVGAAAGHRGMGSVAIAAIARIVWLLARDPDDASQFILSRSWANLGLCPKSRVYSLTSSSPESSDVRVVWGGETDRTADDLVAKPDAEPRGARRKEAEDFLRERLADGPMAVKDLERLAVQQGISRATLHRARESMFIHADLGTWRLMKPEDQASPAAAEMQRAAESSRGMVN